MTNIELYINSLKGEKKSQRTIDSYVDTIDKMLTFINKSENKITYADLTKWRATIGHLASSTIYQRTEAVKSYFNFLRKIGAIEKNIAEDLEGVRYKNKQRDYIPFEDVVTMIDYGKNPRDKAIIATYLTIGLRATELINLTLQDYLNGFAVITTKGDKERTIYFNETCSKYINDYLKVRKDSGIDNLFVSNQGNHMNVQCISNTLKVVAKRAGIEENISNHTLRHSITTKICNEQGVDNAQAFIGHSNIQTTLRYVHKTQEQIKNTAMGISF